MRAYIIRRLLLIIPTLLLVTVIIFFLARMIPGNVIDIMLAEQPIKEYKTDEKGGRFGVGEYTRADIEHALGLDVPIHVQYGRWLSNIILHGDLGTSLYKKTPVLREIINRLPVSFELGLIAIFTALLIALPVGVYSAIRQDTVGDYLGRSLAIACIALPSFWLGTLVMVVPAIWWRWSPSMEYVSLVEDPLANLGMLIIPGIILGMVMSGTCMRMTRTMMLEVLRQDYIRTAWSKGLREKVVVMRHALKNALIPVVTIIGLQLPVLIGGSVILEQIFNLPGIGRLLVDVINNRDYTMLSGINLFIAFLVLLINLGVDVVYAYLDPRIRYR